MFFVKACTGAFLNLTLLLKIKKRSAAKPDEAVKKLYISQALCHLVLNFFLMPLSITASVTRKYLFTRLLHNFKNKIMQNLSWPWGDMGCKYYGFVGMAFGMFMMTNMMFISIDLFFEGHIKDCLV